MWMSINSSPVPGDATLHLAGGAPVAFRGARGVVLECVSGRLWVTIAGQPGDFFLVAGESLRVDSDGLGLVEGMPAGVLRVLAATALKQAMSPALPEALAAGAMAWLRPRAT